MLDTKCSTKFYLSDLSHSGPHVTIELYYSILSIICLVTKMVKCLNTKCCELQQISEIFARFSNYKIHDYSQHNIIIENQTLIRLIMS